MIQIGKSNVKWSEIRDALNRNGGSVSNKAEDAFKVTNKDNKWARFKPTRYNIKFHPAADADINKTWYWSEELQCGLNVPLYTSSDDIKGYSGNMTELWTRDYPIGGETQPFRLGDFSCYLTSARSILESVTRWPEDGVAIKEIDSGVLLECKFYNNISESDISSNTSIDFTEISYSKANTDEIKNKNLSTLYFGCFVFTPNNSVGVMSHENSFSELPESSTDYQELRRVSFNISNELYDIEGEYMVYPVLFRGRPYNSSGDYTFLSTTSISTEYVPLPCEPLTFKVDSIYVKQTYIADSSSITYNKTDMYFSVPIDAYNKYINTLKFDNNSMSIYYYSAYYDNTDSSTKGEYEFNESNPFANGYEQWIVEGAGVEISPGENNIALKFYDSPPTGVSTTNMGWFIQIHFTYLDSNSNQRIIASASADVLNINNL